MWKMASIKDYPAIFKFIKENEFLIDFQITNSSIGFREYMDMAIKNGGFIVDIVSDKIEGVSMYTIGTLVNNFSDTETGCIVLILLPPQKKAFGFITGLLSILHKMRSHDVRFVEFKVNECKKKLIKLYTKFADVVGEQKNLAGNNSVLFYTPIDSIFNRLSHYADRIKKDII